MLNQRQITSRSSYCTSWGIEMDPAGTPKIEVTFEIDVKGLPSVKAVDLTTESEKKFSI